MTDKEIGYRKAAREILTMIEEICFSDDYRKYRVENGSHGERDLIIASIKQMLIK